MSKSKTVSFSCADVAGLCTVQFHWRCKHRSTFVDVACSVQLSLTWHGHHDTVSARVRLDPCLYQTGSNRVRAGPMSCDGLRVYMLSVANGMFPIQDFTWIASAPLPSEPKKRPCSVTKRRPRRGDQIRYLKHCGSVYDADIKDH